MPRQTAFPGIIVEQIDARAGGGGRSLEFDEGLPEDINTERIESFTSQINIFGSDLVENKLTYHLHVAAYNNVSAKAKARAFVRLKNPFEPDVIEVSEPEKLKDLGVLKGGRNAYSVTVEVKK